MIPNPNVEIKYLLGRSPEEKMIYHGLQKNFQDCYIEKISEEFNKFGTIIIYNLIINKTENLNSVIDKGEDIFNKICLILRLTCGGSAHYDFIKPFYLGNYSNRSAIIKEFPENHQLSYSDEETVIRNGPFDTWIKRLWEHIYAREYSEWIFPNQKIRDSYYRNFILKSDVLFDKKFKFFRQIERLVDLIQALENLMGGSGSINRKPVAKLMANNNSEKENEIEKSIGDLYKLRDKYIHGSINSLTSLYENKFGNLDKFKEAINTFEYYLRRIMIFDIVNTDFKDKMTDYKNSLKPITEIITSGPAQPMEFPDLNTIYY